MLKKSLLSALLVFVLTPAAGAETPPELGELGGVLGRLYRLGWTQVATGQARALWPVELSWSSEARKDPEALCDGTVTLAAHYFVRDGDCFACDTLVFLRRTIGDRCAEELSSVTVRRLFDSQESARQAAQLLLAPMRELAAKDETFFEETWHPVGSKVLYWWQRIPLSGPGGENFEAQLSQVQDGWLLHLQIARNPN